MNGMNEQQLFIFTVLAETCNFSETGRRLHMSQPAVSHQIGLLEDQVGVALFTRTSRHVELTDAGRALLKSARNILQMMAEARVRTAEAAELIQGPLFLASSMTIGEFILPKVLKEYRQRFPTVELHLRLINSVQVLQSLASGDIQVGMIEGPAPADFPSKPFLDDTLVLVVPADHPWAARDKVPVQWLKEQPLILREKGSGTRGVIEESFAEAGVPTKALQIDMEFESTQAIKGAVEAGLGLSLLSRWAIEKEVQLGMLKPLSVQGLSLRRTFRLVYREGELTVPAREFTQLILSSSFKPVKSSG